MPELTDFSLRPLSSSGKSMPMSTPGQKELYNETVKLGKFCGVCKHVRHFYDTGIAPYARDYHCYHPVNVFHISLITGSAILINPRCADQREQVNSIVPTCGIAGRWFERGQGFRSPSSTALPRAKTLTEITVDDI